MYRKRLNFYIYLGIVVFLFFITFINSNNLFNKSGKDSLHSCVSTNNNCLPNLTIKVMDPIHKEILSSNNFIVLMVSVGILLLAAITTSTIAIVRQIKRNKSKVPWELRKPQHKEIQEEKNNAFEYIQRDYSKLFVISIGLFITYFFFDLTIKLVATSVSAFLFEESFSYIVVILVLKFIIAFSMGLFFVLNLISLMKYSTKKLSLALLSLLWLVWILVVPISELVFKIIVMSQTQILALMEIEIYFIASDGLSPIFHYLSMIFNSIGISYSCILWYLTTIIIFNEINIQGKGILHLYNFATWFISSNLIIAVGIIIVITNYAGPYGAWNIILWAMLSIYFSFIVINVLGLLSFAIILTRYINSFGKARSLLLQKQHSKAKILEVTKELRKNYMPIANVNFNNIIESEVINQSQIAFLDQRFENHLFLLFLDDKNHSRILLKKVNSLIQEFPNMNVYVFDAFERKKLNFLHAFQWTIKQELEFALEFNFKKLPALFVLNAEGIELGSITKFSSLKNLIDEITFRMDVGVFL